MANYKTFYEDLAEGKKAEHLVAQYLDGDVINGKFAPYDITVEVKWDKRSQETGNVAFEVGRKGKDSGMKGTLAHVVFYRIGNEFWACPVDKCWKFLDDFMKKFPKSVLNGGDNYDSKLVLVPLFIFKQFFTYVCDVKFKPGQ